MTVPKQAHLVSGCRISERKGEDYSHQCIVVSHRVSTFLAPLPMETSGIEGLADRCKVEGEKSA